MLQVFTMGMRYLKQSGVTSTFYRSLNFIDNKIKYNKLYNKHKLDEQELIRQREKKFQYTPKVSVLVPLYKTPEIFLREMIDSVVEQTYSEWELCLADGTAQHSQVTDIVAEYQKKYGDKIKYKILENNAGISENTNEALELATGEYVCLLDHDDVLTLDALYYLVETINANQDADSIYTDEDKMDKSGKSFFNPRFKPDFNIDYLRSNNYICHLFCTRTEIARNIGGFHSDFDGSQDYDFVFRCTEQSRNVYHVPRVLYHWRYHENSTAARAESKLYAYEAGKKAVEAHYQRLGLKAHVTMPEYGYYITDYDMKEQPWITVVVSDHTMKQGDSQGNGLSDQSLDKLTKQYQKIIQYQNIHLEIIDHITIQSLSEIAANTQDKYMLLCDKRIESVSDNGIVQMLGYLSRADVGIVSSKTIDLKGRIYHNGIIMGLYNGYGYSHRGVPAPYKAYYGRTSMPQDISAVDGTFTLLKTEILSDLSLRSAQSDISGHSDISARSSQSSVDETEQIVDLCLAIQQDGSCGAAKKVIILPYVKSSINADVKAQMKLDQKANHKDLYDRWKKYYKCGDPYYNPNLSLCSNIYKIRYNDNV